MQRARIPPPNHLRTRRRRRRTRRILTRTRRILTRTRRTRRRTRRSTASSDSLPYSSSALHRPPPHLREETSNSTTEVKLPHTKKQAKAIKRLIAEFKVIAISTLIKEKKKKKKKKKMMMMMMMVMMMNLSIAAVVMLNWTSHSHRPSLHRRRSAAATIA
jgi:hypothetical protein